MELLRVEEVHLTYPPRFRRQDGGSLDSDGGDDGLDDGAVEEGEGEAPEVSGRRVGRDQPTVALRGVSLTVGGGESVGLLGAVGSGRSTLLSLIGGMLRPDEGRVLVRGTVTGLMAGGAGFFGDLSVRKNIVRNAMLMGIPHDRATALAPQIAAFAEMEETLDTPVRELSRMQSRALGYAIALHAEPTVFLGDEELAVGSPAVKQAGLELLAAKASEDHALVIATNKPDLLKRLCSRGVVLDNGTVSFDGPLAEALRFFRRGPRHEEGTDPADE